MRLHFYQKIYTSKLIGKIIFGLAIYFLLYKLYLSYDHFDFLPFINVRELLESLNELLYSPIVIKVMGELLLISFIDEFISERFYFNFQVKVDLKRIHKNKLIISHKVSSHLTLDNPFLYSHKTMALAE